MAPAQWKCQKCGTSNWSTRTTCRGKACSKPANRRSPKEGNGGNDKKQPKPMAPLQTLKKLAEESTDQKEQDELWNMHEDMKARQRQNRPPLESFTEAQKAVDRTRKRITGIKEWIEYYQEKLTEEKDTLDEHLKSVQEAKGRLDEDPAYTRAHTHWGNDWRWNDEREEEEQGQEDMDDRSQQEERSTGWWQSGSWQDGSQQQQERFSALERGQQEQGTALAQIAQQLASINAHMQQQQQQPSGAAPPASQTPHGREFVTPRATNRARREEQTDRGRTEDRRGSDRSRSAQSARNEVVQVAESPPQGVGERVAPALQGQH